MLKRLTNIVLYNLHILTILMMCSLYLMFTRSFVFQIGQNIILHYSCFYLDICIPSGFLFSRPAWLRRGVPPGQQRVGRAAARAAKPRIISPENGRNSRFYAPWHACFGAVNPRPSKHFFSEACLILRNEMKLVNHPRIIPFKIRECNRKFSVAN